MGFANDARDFGMAAMFIEQANTARQARHDRAASLVPTEVDRRAAVVLGDEPSAVLPATFHHRVQMERRIEQGAPPFNHALHLALTLFTGGCWSVGWVVAWMRSPRRRYLRYRRFELRQAGLYPR